MATVVDTRIESILGDEAAALLQHECKTIPKANLHLPGPDSVERIYGGSDRPAISKIVMHISLFLVAHSDFLGSQNIIAEKHFRSRRA